MAAFLVILVQTSCALADRTNIIAGSGRAGRSFITWIHRNLAEQK